MKKTMNTPGFTAEAALPKGGGRYQVNTAAAISGGTVQPAASKVVFPNHPVFCLKFICNPDPTTLKCRWETKVGEVNPATGRCEL
jgi:hypothetical protein